MEVEIDSEKSLEQNASLYFERAKLAKKKLSGLRKAMLNLEKKASQKEKKAMEKPLSKKRKRQWFQVFHWFKTSDGFLVIGGRDARSNETVVKKHLDKQDIFLHADIQGGSACVIKTKGKKVSKESLQEAAQFAAVRSKAQQQQLSSVDVYAVESNQVSKSAPSGEALGTGAFMIYGKRQWFRKTPLQFAIGLLKENKGFLAMGGPPKAVKKHCIASFEIMQGKQRKSDVAKELLKRFERKTGQKQPVQLDEIAAVLPGQQLSIEERF